jgi:hypothetical protein
MPCCCHLIATKVAPKKTRKWGRGHEMSGDEWARKEEKGNQKMKD